MDKVEKATDAWKTQCEFKVQLFFFSYLLVLNNIVWQNLFLGSVIFRQHHCFLAFVVSHLDQSQLCRFEVVWLPVRCQAGIILLSGCCQDVVRRLSRGCQVDVRWLSVGCQVVAIQLLGGCKVIVRRL